MNVAKRGLKGYKVTAKMDWQRRKIIFVTGKGGTGKSSMCLALAMKAREAGLRPLLIETDLLGVFGQIYNREIRHEAAEITRGIWACKLDFFDSLRDYISHYIPAGKLIEFILRNNIIRSFLSATPSAKELVFMSSVVELHGKKLPSVKRPPDIVIVDMPASGHAVMMLKVPRVTLDLMQRGPLYKRALEVHEFLKTPNACGVVIMTLPEELAVREAIETRAALEAQAGYPIISFVMNFFAERASEKPELDDELSALNPENFPDARLIISAAKREALFRKQCAQYKKELSEAVKEPIHYINEIITETAEQSGIEIAVRISETL